MLRAASTSAGPACVSQEGLPLPDGVLWEAGAADDLRACHEFSMCTCCDAGHTASVLAQLAPALASQELSHECKRLTQVVSCRPCDPEVGTRGAGQPRGTLGPLCGSLCEMWYEACRLGFYTFDGTALRPCDEGRSLVCRRLEDLIDPAPPRGGGASFCARAGYDVADHEPCYSGGGGGSSTGAAGLCSPGDRRTVVATRYAQPSTRGRGSTATKPPWNPPSTLAVGLGLVLAVLVTLLFAPELTHLRRGGRGQFAGRRRRVGLAVQPDVVASEARDALRGLVKAGLGGVRGTRSGGTSSSLGK